MQFQLAPQLRAGDFAAQQCAVSHDRLCYLVGGFTDEFEAKVAHAQREQSFDVFSTSLGRGVEECVTAADIGLEHVLRAHVGLDEPGDETSRSLGAIAVSVPEE